MVLINYCVSIRRSHFLLLTFFARSDEGPSFGLLLLRLSISIQCSVRGLRSESQLLVKGSPRSSLRFVFIAKRSQSVFYSSEPLFGEIWLDLAFNWPCGLRNLVQLGCKTLQLNVFLIWSHTSIVGRQVPNLSFRMIYGRTQGRRYRASQLNLLERIQVVGINELLVISNRPWGWTTSTLDKSAVRIETDRCPSLSTAWLKSFLTLTTSVVLPCCVGLARRGNDTNTKGKFLLWIFLSTIRFVT